mmetsp:Transcript_27901/g.82728  ORF Transcript_27901/g.82728 Transcript_27901/m.82728 type:complete len:337 (-) Transcript_27901:461-1471(-)
MSEMTAAASSAALVKSGHHIGRGCTIHGAVSTPFWGESKRNVLCTKPTPEPMSCGVPPGNAPHGSPATTKAIIDGTFTPIAPYLSFARKPSHASSPTALRLAGWHSTVHDSEPQQRSLAKSAAASRNDATPESGAAGSGTSFRHSPHVSSRSSACSGDSPSASSTPAPASVASGYAARKASRRLSEPGYQPVRCGSRDSLARSAARNSPRCGQPADVTRTSAATQLWPLFCSFCDATCVAWYSSSALLHSVPFGGGTMMTGVTQPSSAVTGLVHLGGPVRSAVGDPQTTELYVASDPVRCTLSTPAWDVRYEPTLAPPCASDKKPRSIKGWKSSSR